MIRYQWRRYRRKLLGVLVCASIVLLTPSVSKPQSQIAIATAPKVTTSEISPAPIATQLSQGQALYEAGQLTEAKQALEAGLRTARSQNDSLNEAITLSNLALVYGQLGDWSAANQAIAQALTQIEPDQSAVLAQILTVQGRLQFGQGQVETAFVTWGEASQRYQSAGNQASAIRAQLRQARALQALGFHRRAITEILLPLQQTLANADNTPEKALGLQSLAQAYQMAESLQAAYQTAETALAVSEAIESPEAIASTALRLGNITTAQAKDYRDHQLPAAEAATDQAIAFYQKAIDTFPAQTNAVVPNQLRVRLNQLSALVDAERFTPAKQLWPTVAAQLEQLVPHRESIYARINLAETLIRLAQSFTPEQAKAATPAATLSALEAAQHLLEVAEAQAETLGDRRAQAYVLGYLGQIYEGSGQPESATSYTSRAVLLAQQVNAVDLNYRWSAQLGNVLEQQGDKAGAIAAYSSAIKSLKQMRSDLVSLSPEIQFSFEKSIDPIHRQLISLLLDPKAGNPSQENLLKARDAIESLREAELVNFFRAACLDAQPSQATYGIKGTETTAFIHTVILRDRLELIVQLPGEQRLRNYTTVISADELDKLARTLRQRISTTYYSNSGAFRGPASQLYQVLFSAAVKQGESTFAQELPSHAAQSLAFVLDGSLRNLPISALYNEDRKDFVLNEYQIVTTPGFQLLNAHPRQNRGVSTLIFGLTEARQGFEALPNVEKEVEILCSFIPCETWFNQDFTREQFLRQTDQATSPIVHLATHGQFGAQLDETFVLTWNENLSVSDFNQWLRNSNRSLAATELLVLSACETAVSDDRTALGLAGIAVRAGARSTLASLWKVDDRMTALMIPKFYEALAQQGATKASALQAAQAYIIERYPEYKHPFYWSAFTLVGSWL